MNKYSDKRFQNTIRRDRTNDASKGIGILQRPSRTSKGLDIYKPKRKVKYVIREAHDKSWY